ncbi:MAG: nicotinate phosphoribosyltransferase [Acidobacteria bacterium]|nr:nicotinate phosphoribosyltransferase [Acidobacteriota bacterium]
MSKQSRIDLAHPSLFVDLYELTMARAYVAEGMNESAVFELFFRELPPTRNYVLACGHTDVLDFLENLRFEDSALEYLRSRKDFPEEFLDYLSRFRFSGDVYAVPEGTVVFPHEPVIQIHAPLTEAQIIETYVLNQIHFQSVVASKAARIVTAAQGRPIIDFASRRAHGTDAALKVARASYLAGFTGTSNVLAGKTYGIPLYGTMAHSYVQAHDDEKEALRRFASLYPNTTLLIDTYDTLDGLRKVIEVVRDLGPGHRPSAVRLDSGDLAELARQSRAMLDQAGLNEVKIFASSDLDEVAIARLLDGGAPVDGFGVGTNLAVSRDAPYLDFVYKLVEYAGQPRFKLSSRKILLPGRKQVFRRERDGLIEGDTLAHHSEALEGKALLARVMRDGRRTGTAAPSLEKIREWVRAQLEALPSEIRALEKHAAGYPVKISRALEAEHDRLRASIEMAGR